MMRYPVSLGSGGTPSGRFSEMEAQVRATLKDLRARKARRRRELHRALHSVSRQLRDMGALKIVVFGSLAREQVPETCAGNREVDI